MNIRKQYKKLPLDIRLQRNSIITPSGCWKWIKNVTDKGYGRIQVEGVNYRAHRVSYEVFNGPIGELQVLHSCDNRACINPSHLFLGTHEDNMSDMVNKGRSPERSGDKNPSVKLTSTQVLRIRSDDRKVSIIAQEYGVNPSTINKIKRRDIWSHI